MQNQEVSLLKYHLVFTGSYFALALASNLLPAKVAPVLSLVVTFIAAFIAVRWFCKDHGRGLDAGERWRMLRFGVIVITLLGLAGMLMIKAAYDASVIARIQGRTFPGWVIVVGLPVLAIVTSFQLWLAYYKINHRAYPGTSDADQPGPAWAPIATTAAQPVRAKLRVLVLGSGAREHALAWKLSQSPRVLEVQVAPGNAGMAHEAKVRALDADLADGDALLALARREAADLILVSPDVPAAAALVDRLRALDFRVLGPGLEAERLADPAFTLEMLQRHDLPTLHAADDAGAFDLLLLADGTNAIALATSKSDEASLSAVSPSALRPGPDLSPLQREVVAPLMRALVAEGLAFPGFLGLRLAPSPGGTIQVVQLRPWPGDPETQAVMTRLQVDLLGLLEAAADGRIAQMVARLNPNACQATVMQAGVDGVNQAIGGLGQRASLEVKVFHDRTYRAGDAVLAGQARSLTVCALAGTAAECQMITDDTLGRITWGAVAPV